MRVELTARVKYGGSVHESGEILEMADASARLVLAAGNAVAVEPEKRASAAEVVAAIAAAQTVAELDALAEGDERKSVLAAADKRRAELSEQ